MKQATCLWRVAVLVAAYMIVAVPQVLAQTEPPPTESERAISSQLHKLRDDIPDDRRSTFVAELEPTIRRLPISLRKVRLANALALLATEGEIADNTLQQVTDGLSSAIEEYERTGKAGYLPYVELAYLTKYEGMRTWLKNQKIDKAIAEFEASDKISETADFTLTDLQGTKWNLRSLRGKVVILDFWATWCPPCVKELAELRPIYIRNKPEGLVILAVSDEDPNKLREYVAANQIDFVVLPDVQRKAHAAFRIEDIPRTFVYDRDGKLLGQARSRRQFARLLARTSLR